MVARVGDRVVLSRVQPFSKAAVLLRLSRLLGNPDYWSEAERVLRTADDAMRGRPRAHLNLLCALDYYLEPTTEIAIVGKAGEDDTKAMLDVIHRRFLPNRLLALAEPGGVDGETLGRLVPLLEDKGMVGGKATAYVCENYTCRRPVDNAVALEKTLDRLRDSNK